MKNKRINKKLATILFASLAIQSSVYAAEPIYISPRNDGTGGQPMQIADSSLFEYTYELNYEPWLEFFGAHASGNNATTVIDANEVNTLSIHIGEDRNPDKKAKYISTTGIYTGAGATTKWHSDVSGSEQNVDIQVLENENFDAIGIYTKGERSNFSNDKENNGKFYMRTDGRLYIEKTKVDAQEQAPVIRKTQLNEAFDDYVSILRNYGNYGTEEEYFAAVAHAETRVEAERKKYGEILSSMDDDTLRKIAGHTVGVFANNNATNDVNFGSFSIESRISSESSNDFDVFSEGNTLEKNYINDVVKTEFSLVGISSNDNSINKGRFSSIDVSGSVSTSVYNDVAYGDKTNYSGRIEVSGIEFVESNVVGISATNRSSNILRVDGNVKIDSDVDNIIRNKVRNNSRVDVDDSGVIIVSNESIYSSSKEVGIQASGNSKNDIMISGDLELMSRESHELSLRNDRYKEGTNDIHNTYMYITKTNIGIEASKNSLNNIFIAGNLRIDGNIDIMMETGFEDIKPTDNHQVFIRQEAFGIKGSEKSINNIKVEGIELDSSIVESINDGSFITSSGIYGESGAINNIDVKSIEINGEMNFESPEDKDENYGIFAKSAGIYATSGATNNVKVDNVSVSLSFNESGHIDGIEQVKDLKVYGLYGDGKSVTNLYRNTQDGEIEIKMDFDFSGGNNEDSGIGQKNLEDNTYGVYLNDARLNIYNDVNIVGDEVEFYDIHTGEHVNRDIVVKTHLNNSTINFAGYRDYNDPFMYFDETDQTWKNHTDIVAGSDKFHSYKSLGGQLELGGSNNFIVNTDLVNGNSDKLSFNTIAVDGKTGVQYIGIGWEKAFSNGQNFDEILPIVGETTVIEIKETDRDLESAAGIKTDTGSYDEYYAVKDKNGDTVKIKFAGKGTMYDTQLQRKLITPTVQTKATETVNDDGSITYGRDVVITKIDYVEDGPSEGIRQTNDAQKVMRNLWQMENESLMQRMGQIQSNGEKPEDGIWVRYAKGKMESEGNYNRNINQNYNKIQIGYDKGKDVEGGRRYTGAALGHIYGSVGYENGSGDAKSTTLSLYTVWMGDKGHYYDIVAKAGRLSNDLDIRNAAGKDIHGDYSTMGYGLSAEYGYRQKLDNGYFVEPQAQLSLGHISKTDYYQSDGVHVDQSGITSAILRLGVLAGKEFKNGNAYLKAGVLKDLGQEGTIRFSYDGESTSTDGVSNKAWFELGLGTNIQLAKNNKLYFDAMKTFGGNTKYKWQFNAGLRWTF